MPETAQFHIPDAYLPDWSALEDEIIARFGTEIAASDFGLDFDALRTPHDHDAGSYYRNGSSRSKTLVRAWADRLTEVHSPDALITAYRLPIEVPVDDSGRFFHETKWERYSDPTGNNNPGRSRTSPEAAYQFFGIPVSDWTEWYDAPGKIGRKPHLIYRHIFEASERGMTLTPTAYTRYYRALQDMLKLSGGSYLSTEWDEVISISQMKTWAARAAALGKLGLDHAEVEDFGYWVADDWAADAIKHYHDLGYAQVAVSRLYLSGITDRSLRDRVLSGQVPEEWALNMMTSRTKGAQR